VIQGRLARTGGGGGGIAVSDNKFISAATGTSFGVGEGGRGGENTPLELPPWGLAGENSVALSFVRKGGEEVGTSFDGPGGWVGGGRGEGWRMRGRWTCMAHRAGGKKCSISEC